MKFLPAILTLFLQCCNYLISHSQQINIYKYSIQDGLVNNDVLKIYQDSQGFIWICTRGGLSRYDGTRFTNYTTENGLTNDMINDIHEVAPQEFIIAQNLNGPRMFKGGRITPFSDENKVIINNFYRTGNNRLLVATDYDGILEVKGNGFQQINPASRGQANQVTIVNDSLWLVQEDQSSIQLMTPLLVPFSLKTQAFSSCAYTDSRHNTWVGTSYGLMLLAPQQYRNQRIQFLPLPSGFDLPLLRENFILDIMEDSQKNFWICTSAGLVLIRPNGKSTVFTEFHGLPASMITCISEDRQNNLWVGSPLGLAKFSLRNEVKIYSHKDGFSAYGAAFVLPITPNATRLFGINGISEFDFTTEKLSERLFKDSSIHRLYRLGKDEIALLNNHKASFYKRNNTSEEIVKFPSRYYGSVKRLGPEKFIASYDNILFSISQGVIQDTTYFSSISHIPCLEFYNKNTLLLGTFNTGIYKINLDGHSMQISDSITDILPDKHIRALFSDKENEIWIGTRYKGVIRLVEFGKGRYQIQQFGTLQGLSANFVKTINRDKIGNIWVGTMQGLDKLVPQGDGFHVFNFGKLNKIYSQILDIDFLPDNYLLAAGYPYFIYARDMQLDTLPPQVAFLTKVQTEFRTNSFPQEAHQTRLPYDKARIDFEFSVPQFINEEFIQTSYRLLGKSDTAWIHAAKSRSVSFANLKPGKYIFEVRALGFNGRWGPIASHHFIVVPPFWQEAWFVILIGLLIALGVYMLYLYRIRQLMRLQKVRNHIAADLHDEIGSNLTNISILSTLSKKNILKPQEATEFLQRISEEVSSSSQALDDIIWSVNTNHDTLDETVSRMRRYAAELFDAANIQYELQLDVKFEEQKLIMEQRRDVYLLYKESVNNILKHAEAKHVTIKISIEHQMLILDITDDGKGFTMTNESGRHGLQGMRARVDKWKGKIQIASAKNKGTSIHCRLPLVR
ncbi:MAG: hypothetical protein H7122_18105 [Chitinophagaceae bacterium]|nr:hypothetical protein [Chitinophagaceae bacterium]